GSRANPTRLTFSEANGSLVSDIALPEGNDIPVVLMITPFPSVTTVMEKFNVNLSSCPGCKYEEYACTCGHENVRATEDEDEHEHPHRR
ncbi:MAG: hypothetical protein O3C57_01135, partial [Verrucomicrobia bacterium]|nr:hypothetical protein [Verrucomicrobiota bacterium]